MVKLRCCRVALHHQSQEEEEEEEEEGEEEMTVVTEMAMAMMLRMREESSHSQVVVRNDMAIWKQRNRRLSLEVYEVQKMERMKVAMERGAVEGKKGKARKSTRIVLLLRERRGTRLQQTLLIIRFLLLLLLQKMG